jgi:hypothetical protein
MPDFMPMIRGALPYLVAVAVFVAVVQLVAFCVRRWKNV